MPNTIQRRDSSSAEEEWAALGQYRVVYDRTLLSITPPPEPSEEGHDNGEGQSRNISSRNKSDKKIKPIRGFEVPCSFLTTRKLNVPPPPAQEVAFSYLPQRVQIQVTKAVSNVLASHTAHRVLFQIAEGLPTRTDFLDRFSGTQGFANHPSLNFLDCCRGTAERTKMEMMDFNVYSINLEYNLVLDMLESVGRDNAMAQACLIEMTAVIIHKIAAHLYTKGLQLHKEHSQEFAQWKPDRRDEAYKTVFPDGSPNTLFFHRYYTNVVYYPRGVADIVGFWAENRIFGGVVLFNRRGGGAQREMVYLHADRKDRNGIYLLSNQHRQQLVAFLLGTVEDGKSPLPFDPYTFGPFVVDPDANYLRTGIYRYLWERPNPAAYLDISE